MESRKAYTQSFASIYDDIMGAVPYGFWYDYLQELLKYYHLKPWKVLDLACGTGSMSLLFAEDGYQVTGLDSSPDMLKVAREKADKKDRKVNFVEADLRDFALEEKHDLAFSLFDSFNYILELTDLQKVFQNVYNALNDKGVFIFDMNTPARLMSIKPGTTMITGDTYSCIWEDIINKEKIRWQVRLKIYLENKGEYFEEFHQETAYDVEDVVKSLESAGFAHIDTYNAYTFDKGSNNDNRIYYVAFKEKPDVKKDTGLGKHLYRMKWKIKKGLAGAE
jgi:ubiquinone/menaquinone biosynthesis C-methylase UbiE